MASNYTGLGVQLMTTGEKAGLWGGYTNTNWEIMEQTAGGYLSQALSTTGATTLAVADGTSGDTNQVAHRIIEFTAALAGNVTVTIPLDVQNFYIIKNSTTNSFSVEFKYVTGSGSSVTWASGDRGYKILYAAADDVTNPNIVDVGMATLTGTETLTNKTLTSPNIITGINDTNTNELIKVTATGSAINELTIANAATGNGPIISTTGGDAAVDLNLNPKGAGVLKSGTAAVKIAGTETIFVPTQAMFGTDANGADAQTVVTTATRPEMKLLDFDASTIEYAQFSIAMPKSWNEGTITFQAFWAPSNTDTGDALIGLQAVSVPNDSTSDVVFGTAIYVTDAGGGALEDVMVSPVSAAVTVAAAAVDTYTYFQVLRNATDGADDFTGDVRLLGIKIFYTTDAANDA